MLNVIEAITSVVPVFRKRVLQNHQLKVNKVNRINKTVCRRRAHGNLAQNVNPKDRESQHYSHSSIIPDTPLDRNWQAVSAPV